MLRHWSQIVPNKVICQPTSEDMKLYNIIINALHRAQELCESRGGRPGLPTVSVDVKQHSTKIEPDYNEIGWVQQNRKGQMVYMYKGHMVYMYSVCVVYMYSVCVVVCGVYV